MQKTTFKIGKMDCSSEEQLIRLKLNALDSISSLEFDLSNRTLDVWHSGEFKPILNEINDLHLDASLVRSRKVDEMPLAVSHRAERKLLLQVLCINLFFFFFEALTGFISNSMGLVADGLDMLADAFVYALALFAVGGTTTRKKGIAKASGYLQLLLAVSGIAEVARRFLGFAEIPSFQIMIIVSAFALMGNAASLLLLQKSTSTEAHMRASVIFTSNDVIINLGVIVAGVMVYGTKTKIPDLIVGTIVFMIVARGAHRILQLAK